MHSQTESYRKENFLKSTFHDVLQSRYKLARAWNLVIRQIPGSLPQDPGGLTSMIKGCKHYAMYLLYSLISIFLVIPVLQSIMPICGTIVVNTFASIKHQHSLETLCSDIIIGMYNTTSSVKSFVFCEQFRLY